MRREAANLDRPVQRRLALTLPLVAAALAVAQPAAAGDARTAAVQVALHAKGLYSGPVDGVAGPRTLRAIRQLQHRAGLRPDGVVGPQTERALGRFARHAFGTRTLSLGKEGWDVAALQFLLAEHGFSSGSIDGGFGLHTDWALRRFQFWAGLAPDGRAGPATYAALRRAAPRCPLALRRPVRGRVVLAFGPGRTGYRNSVVFTAAPGTAVAAAATGRVVATARGRVVLAHAHHVRTSYTGVVSVRVHVGEVVAAGSTLALVARRPVLAFRVTVRGAAVDPLPALR